MQKITNYIKNPIYALLGYAFKKAIKYLLFKNVENTNFNNLVNNTLEFIPNETLGNLFILVKRLFKWDSSQLMTHTKFKDIVENSLFQEDKKELLSCQSKKLNYFFILLILSNIFKRGFSILKLLILIPFQIGIFAFMGNLIGFKLDNLLSNFNVFKFNIPQWTYNKLLDLHLKWLEWLKSTV